MLPSIRDTGCWCCMQPLAFVLGKDREGFPGRCQAPMPFFLSPAQQLLGQGRGQELGCPPPHPMSTSPALL